MEARPLLPASGDPTPSQRVTREDLLTFVSAAFACTGQREFHADGRGQQISIKFLHDYVVGNYRRLYARMLACGINHFNQAEIVLRLLATGKQVRPEDRAEENALVTRALERLPTQRAMRLVSRLAEEGVNNRRTRAIVARYLSRPESRDFRAVKYRRHVRRGMLHAHVAFPDETAAFLGAGIEKRRFTTPLFEQFRAARHSERAVYELPFSIAEGLARKHGIPRATFLEKIAPKMTVNERLRFQETTRKELGESVALDAGRLSPTKLATFALGLPEHVRVARRDELEAAFAASTARAARLTGVRYARVACVLDRSWSASGSSEKRRRPLAVALATGRFLAAVSDEARSFWTEPVEDDLAVTAHGATDLATPILAALAWKPELLVVVSDGFENDPPEVAGDLLAAARRRGLCPFVIHVNPVFDDASIGPKPLTLRFPDLVPTFGIRDAEDIPTAIAFSAFAHGAASLAELEATLATRVKAFLA